MFYSLDQLMPSKRNLKALQRRYGNRCCSKTDNLAVLYLYEYVLEKENSNIEYWSLYSVFKKHFLNQEDWEQLELDVRNWTMMQLEQFTAALIDSFYGHTYSLNFKLDPYLFLTEKLKIIQRLLEVGKIKKAEGAPYDDIRMVVHDKVGLLNISFETFVACDDQKLNIILEILTELDINHMFKLYPDLESRIAETKKRISNKSTTD